MKRILYTILLTGTATCLATAAFADDYGQRQGSMSGSSYSTVEPASGDASREIILNTEDLRNVQQTLNNRGYSAGPVDGIFGPRTESSIRRFQQANDLAVTGTVTADTMTELGLNSDRWTGKTRQQKPSNPPGSYRSDEVYAPQ